MANLTIAQGLRRVRKLKGLLATHAQRAAGVVSYEEGHKPAFDFGEERASRSRAQDEIVRLEAGIARANATNTITLEGREMLLIEAVRRLQELKGDIAWLNGLVIRDGKTRLVDEYGGVRRRSYAGVETVEEVRFIASLGERARAEEVAALQERFDLLNDTVETANHRITVEVPPPASVT